MDEVTGLAARATVGGMRLSWGVSSTAYLDGFEVIVTHNNVVTQRFQVSATQFTATITGLSALLEYSFIVRADVEEGGHTVVGKPLAPEQAKESVGVELVEGDATVKVTSLPAGAVGAKFAEMASIGGEHPIFPAADASLKVGQTFTPAPVTLVVDVVGVDATGKDVGYWYSTLHGKRIVTTPKVAPVPLPEEKPKPPPTKMRRALDTSMWTGIHKPLVQSGITAFRIGSPSIVAGVEAAGGIVDCCIIGSPGASPQSIREQVKAAALKYPKVLAWEVMNEPSINGESPASYAPCLKAAREGLNEAKSTADLYGEYAVDKGFGPAWSKIIPVSTVNAAVQHAYGSSWKRHIEEAHASAGIPIAVTEMGETTALGQPNTGDSVQVSEAQQKLELEQKFAWCISAGYVSCAVWFNAVDYGTNNFYGVMRKNMSRKPSYAALAVVEAA